MESNANPFAAPEAGNLTTNKSDFFPTVDYSAMKTPANFVKNVNAEVVADARANFKLGFHFYDKDAQSRIAIDKFSFVVLETYSKLSGSREISPKQYLNYYSNFVKDTRVEPFSLWEQGVKRPVASGMYQGKKSESDVAKLVSGQNAIPLPAGVGFHQHFVVYWLEGDRILDLKLTTMVSREIKEAISRAEATAGRKVKADRVNLFSLCDGGAFWGFSVTNFRKAEKEGQDYKSGEMFLLPVFACGVVKTQGEGANPDLWNQCAAMQEDIRVNYAADVERRKKFAGDVPNVENPENNPPIGTLATDANFPTSVHDYPPPTPVDGDDLPF